jgi:hypothetical protein
MKNLNTKLTIIIFLSIFVSTLFPVVTANAQVQPFFSVRVTNFVLSDTLGGNDNVLFFDIYILHTNLASSGPFELVLNQYYFNFNPAIAGGGTLSYRIVPGSSQFTNPIAVPRNPSISGNILRLEANIVGTGNGPIISPIFPGTRVVTMRLATTAYSLVSVLNLTWRTALPDPFTQIFA